MVSLERMEIDDEIVLDGKDGIALQVWVVFGEDLIRDGLVVVVAYLKRKRI